MPHVPLVEESSASDQPQGACFMDVYELCSVLRGGSSVTEYLVRNIASGERFLCVELDYTNFRHFNRDFCLAKLMSFVNKSHTNHLAYREFFSDEDACKIHVILEPYINKCLYHIVDQICKGKLTLSDEAIWGIVAQIFNGLYFYHQTDLNGFCGKMSIHGGINAENIYISTSGIVQLGPFRLLSDLDEEIDDVQDENAIILPTSPGSADQSLRVVSDFQALGCIIYEMITGRPLTRDEQLQYYTPAAVQEARHGLPSVMASEMLLDFTKQLLDAPVASSTQILAFADNERLLINIDFAKDVMAFRDRTQTEQLPVSNTEAPEMALSSSTNMSMNGNTNRNAATGVPQYTSVPAPPAASESPEHLAHLNMLIQSAIEPILVEQNHIKEELQSQKELIVKLQEYETRHDIELKAMKKDLAMLQKVILKLTTSEHKEKSGTSRTTSAAARSGTTPRPHGQPSTRLNSARLSSTRSPTRPTKSPRAPRASDADSNLPSFMRSSMGGEERKSTSELKKLKNQMATLTQQLSNREEDILELRRQLECSYQMLSNKDERESIRESDGMHSSGMGLRQQYEEDSQYIKFVCLPCNHLITHKVKENKIHLHNCPRCSGGISNLIVVTDE